MAPETQATLSKVVEVGQAASRSQGRKQNHRFDLLAECWSVFKGFENQYKPTQTAAIFSFISLSEVSEQFFHSVLNPEVLFPHLVCARACVFRAIGSHFELVRRLPSASVAHFSFGCLGICGRCGCSSSLTRGRSRRDRELLAS